MSFWSTFSIARHVCPSHIANNLSRLRGRYLDRPSHSSVWTEATRPPKRCLVCPAQEEGSFFDSKIVQEEITNIMSEFHGLNRLWGKYPDFDIEGKRIFLEHMDHILERLRVFNMRLKLTDDAAVKEYMSTVNKQLMFMSTNTDALYGGLENTVKNMRELLSLEEKITDPAELRYHRQQIAAHWSSAESPTKNLSLENIEKLIMEDPYTMQALVNNPKALLAMNAVAEKGPEAIEDFADEAELYRALKKLFG